MTKDNVFQIVITSVIAGVTSYLQVVAVPIVVLVIAMVTDYITGWICAKKHSSISSRIGIAGIVKKVCYIALVGVGVIVDYILAYGLPALGIDNTLPMIFGLLVTMWLISNELISILENLSKIGVPMPGFLMKLVERLKVTVENKADNTTE
jgi:toxin secretion/phage lysis holin